MSIPKKCNKCDYIGDYTNNPFARNPHYCCELVWALLRIDYRVDPKTLDPNCPLLNDNIRTGIKELEIKFEEDEQ